MSLQVSQHDGAQAPRAAFYFDFSSPEAYLAAERVIGVLADRGEVAEWTPIRAPRDWHAFGCAEEERIAHEAVERTAALRGLQEVRWPPAFDSELALRAATFAKQIGRVVAFTLAAFRQAYAGGHDLGDRDVVLIAAAACEMHPRAVLQAIERDAIARALDDATAQALARGVLDVPAVWTPAARCWPATPRWTACPHEGPHALRAQGRARHDRGRRRRPGRGRPVLGLHAAPAAADGRGAHPRPRPPQPGGLPVPVGRGRARALRLTSRPAARARLATSSATAGP
ncbi:hypothetical protein FSW04_04660 [Baekduia soli]|uniref:DSBA-like thioredoxin domain-containing protein n=1 Tax=Baekduia soli TaxID=496014 RepID=A0A5B8U1U8_9ACTN|nr:hypothetical protein FSW04_04660 [Baekduia soli]